MRKVAILFGVLALAACKDEPDVSFRAAWGMHCGASARITQAEFILECVKSANAAGDKYREEWMPKCKQWADEIYCRPVPGVVMFSRATLKQTWVPCVLASGPEQTNLCPKQ